MCPETKALILHQKEEVVICQKEEVVIIMSRNRSIDYTVEKLRRTSNMSRNISLVSGLDPSLDQVSLYLFHPPSPTSLNEIVCLLLYYLLQHT